MNRFTILLFYSLAVICGCESGHRETGNNAKNQSVAVEETIREKVIGYVDTNYEVQDVQYLEYFDTLIVNTTVSFVGNLFENESYMFFDGRFISRLPLDSERYDFMSVQDYNKNGKPEISVIHGYNGGIVAEFYNFLTLFEFDPNDFQGFEKIFETRTQLVVYGHNEKLEETGVDSALVLTPKLKKDHILLDGVINNKKDSAHFRYDLDADTFVEVSGKKLPN